MKNFTIAIPAGLIITIAVMVAIHFGSIATVAG